jgi:hypothetical protein
MTDGMQRRQELVVYQTQESTTLPVRKARNEVVVTWWNIGSILSCSKGNPSCS